MSSLRHLFTVVWLGLLVVNLGSQSYAQSFGDAFSGVGDNDEPVNIKADRLEVIDEQKIAILTGKVRVVQGTSVVTGKQMRVYYLGKEEKSQTRSGVEKIEITGGVAIKSDENEATADEAIINLINNAAELIGNVHLSQGENIVKACSLWVDLETRHTKLNHSCNERIYIVSTPRDNEEQ